MPGTSDMQVGMLGRTPLAARSGGGIYVAYPTGYPSVGRIRLWRVGAGNAPVVGRVASGSPAVAIAATGDTRMWVLWTKGFGDPDVLARRSNKGATKFGAVVNAGHPKDAAQAYKLDASAVGGALDALGNFNIGTTSTAVTSYRRILPGLTLKARPQQGAQGRADRGALHRPRRRRGREGREGQGGRQVRHDRSTRPRDAVAELAEAGDREGDARRICRREQAAGRAPLTRASGR